MNPQIYHYDKRTSKFLSASEARLDPRDETPMVPAYATLAAPPAVATNEAAVFDGQTWSVQPDYRGETWYQPDGTLVEFTMIGEAPAADMTQEVPADVKLAQAKDAKITELRNACANEIFAGFPSNALGTEHHYPLSQTDQANMQLAFSLAQRNESVTGWTTAVQALASGEDAPQYREHTAAQVFQVVDDIDTGKKAALTKMASLVSQVKTVNTIAELDAIVW